MRILLINSNKTILIKITLKKNLLKRYIIKKKTKKKCDKDESQYKRIEYFIKLTILFRFI